LEETLGSADQIVGIFTLEGGEFNDRIPLTVYNASEVIIEVDSTESLDSSWINEDILIGEGAIGVYIAADTMYNPDYVWESDEGASDWVTRTVSLVGVVGGIYKYQFVFSYGSAYIGVGFTGIEKDTGSFNDPRYPETNGYYQGPTREYTIVDIRLPTTESFSGTPLAPITIVLDPVGN
jgi:hypothetical protein